MRLFGAPLLALFLAMPATAQQPGVAELQGRMFGRPLRLAGMRQHAALNAVGLSLAGAIGAGATGAAAQPAEVPRPYQPVPGWAQLPPARTVGEVSAVDVGPDGTIWVVDRCGGRSCDGRSEAPVMQFDAEGRLLRSFGAGRFVWPHGIDVDAAGNVWVVDGRAADGKGLQVIKFSPAGEVLMTLGTAGVAGDPPAAFHSPCDVAIAANGDIFVADGHPEDGPVARIVRFDRDGRHLETWGAKGSGPGELSVPHALAFDSAGRLFVGDRANNRIAIYDQAGRVLDTWTQFGRASGLFIDARDRIYVADSESNERRNPGWPRGIWVGSATDGTVAGFIPLPAGPTPGNPVLSNAEGVAVDAAGRVYGGSVSPPGVIQYLPPD